MNKQSGKQVRVSKTMSKILRHEPHIAHLALDSDGWILVTDLVRNMNKFCGTNITIVELDDIVRNDDKGRYMFSEDRKKIRACQGHSVNVNLGLFPAVPPLVLYHGTAQQTIDIILKDGIKKMSRQYVQMSELIETATSVGKRHGKPVILVVDAARLHKDGIPVFQSENGVWLVDFVDPKYLSLLY